MNRHGVTEPAVSHSRRFPVLLVLAYLVVGSLWILVSDELAVRFADSAAELDRWQGLKGWVFVLVTAALLFFLTHRYALRVRRAEQALARERDFSNGVVDTVDAMVVVLDRQGRVVRFNQACERISGKRLAEVRDRPVWEVMVPEAQREQVRAVFEELLHGRFPNHYENHWFTPDGEPRLIAWSNTTLKDADGRVTYVIATGIDITEQRAALAALQSSQEKYRRLLETANDAIFVADAESGRIVEANSRAGELMGMAPEALVGLHQSELHPAEERERYKQIFQEHLETGHVTSDRLYIEHRGGRDVPVEISASVLEAEGRRLVVGIFRDVSQRARVEDQLRKLSRVVEASPNPIIITDADGRIEYANPRFYEATGYRAEEVLGRNPRFLKSGETPPDEYRVMWETLGRGETWFGEFCNRKKDGQLVWWMSTISPIRDADGKITHFVSIAEDVGELKYAESTIRHLAYFDPLTELPNRSLFKDRLEQAADAARYQGQGLGLLFIDLDRFKAVNDTLGHRCGDDLLRAVAERLKGCAAPGRTLARLGGDEFAVIQPAVREPDEVVKIAEEILAVFNEPFDVAGQEVVVTLSIGISLFPQDTTEVETLIGNADLAMFRAKEVGRNTYEFYTADMNAVSFERISLHASLKRALEREEFEVYYQPKIDLAGGRVSGMEALVRWRHPEEGLVSPGRFIPVAEETGLIVPLGEWVLDTACRQARQWQIQGYDGLAVSVNLSAQQFHRRDLSDAVAEALEESGLAPDCLELEITETDVMQNAEQASEILYRLKAMGVRLSIDDFGTGYSSLNYLKRFPIDVLKVDQSFVRDVNDDPDDAAIARSIIALAHSMRLAVVAEGVETVELLRFFRDEGCEEVQGFYFARPVPADEFEALLADPAWLEKLL